MIQGLSESILYRTRASIIRIASIEEETEQREDTCGDGTNTLPSARFAKNSSDKRLLDHEEGDFEIKLDYGQFN